MQISEPEPFRDRVEVKGDETRASRHWLDAWHVNPSLNKDYDAIDGLRGLAILMVLVCHLFYVNPGARPLVAYFGHLAAAGAHGVTIFFALSGFLISHPFWKRKIRASTEVIPKGYGWRRFWKIYPPLALSIVILTPIYFLRTGDSAYAQTAGQWLVGWPIVHPVSGRLNPVMWSLVVETQFYITLPLLFLAMRRVSARASLWIIFATLLVIPTAYRWWNYSRGVWFVLEPEIRLYFPGFLDSFAFGVLLAGLENLQVMKKSWAKLGDVGVVLLMAALCSRAWFYLHPVAAIPIQNEGVTWLVEIAAAMMVCYIADPDHPRARLLSQPWLRWCGLISYEWYLFHQPLTAWIRESFGFAHGNAAKFVAIVGGPFLLSLLIAAVIYRCFSLPILRRGRNRNAANAV